MMNCDISKAGFNHTVLHFIECVEAFSELLSGLLTDCPDFIYCGVFVAAIVGFNISRSLDLFNEATGLEMLQRLAVQFIPVCDATVQASYVDKVERARVYPFVTTIINLKMHIWGCKPWLNRA